MIDYDSGIALFYHSRGEVEINYCHYLFINVKCGFAFLQGPAHARTVRWDGVEKAMLFQLCGCDKNGFE
jgi:hypothetical protein